MKFFKILALSFAFIIGLSNNIIAQQHLFLPLNQHHEVYINKGVSKSKQNINTGFKPLLRSEIRKITSIDSVLDETVLKDKVFSKIKPYWFWRKLLFEDFVRVESENFNLSVNPLLYLQSGNYQDSTSKYTINTRGIELKGDLGDKISFYTSFRENQAFFRPYIDEFVKRRLIVPGQGATKNFKDNGHDFSMANAYISYSPFKFLNIQTGYDKNFVGEGYRSMLLSDNAFSYPFLKLTGTHKSFKYVSMITRFEDFDNKFYLYHTKKHGAFNYLSYNYKGVVELGFFEGIIYQTTDTAAGYINKMPFDYFIPIIGLRSGINGYNSNHKLLTGINLKLNATKMIQLYGQLAADNISKSNLAYQAGIKIHDVFHDKLRNNNLYVQFEYNSANGRVYANGLNRFQSWSHYNQEIAHPFGTDFNEIYLNVIYKFSRLFVDVKYSSAETQNNGLMSDIFSDNVLMIFYNPLKIEHQTIVGGVIINPKTNLQIYGGIDIRKSGDLPAEKFIHFGFRTNISDFYYDF